jgi:hypothetical protein
MYVCTGLTGVIPPQLCSLTTLRRLCICRCGISGRIPSEIGWVNYSNTNYKYSPLSHFSSEAASFSMVKWSIITTMNVFLVNINFICNSPIMHNVFHISYVCFYSLFMGQATGWFGRAAAIREPSYRNHPWVSRESYPLEASQPGRIHWW